MDSNDLEKERGITILAKCTSVELTPPEEGETTRINIVDTPGPRRFRRRGRAYPVDGRWSDPAGRFGRGRDAADQVRHRQGARARACGRSWWSTRSIASDARIQEVLDEVFDLFVSLEASDDQLDFPVLFASGPQRLCERRC